MWAFFAALLPGEFPHTVELADQLARSSTDDQFQFGIRTFLAGLKRPATGTQALGLTPPSRRPPLLPPLGSSRSMLPSPTLSGDVVGI
jgi:hypothetical protein